VADKAISSPQISVVVPVFGCEASLLALHGRLAISLTTITENYEIILVDDSSSDGAWNLIQQLALMDPRIRGARLARNFGQQSAIMAGLTFASGSYIVVMDCDLQDRPEDIPKLYLATQHGFDMAVAVRSERGDSWTRATFSRAFARALSYLTGEKHDPSNLNFGVYSASVVTAVLNSGNGHGSFGLRAIWVGFNRTTVKVDRDSRAVGSSGYRLADLWKLALDSVVGASDKLLVLTMGTGFALSLASFFSGLWIFVSYFVVGSPIVGWTSLISSIFFSTGLIMGSLGILGLYVGRIFNLVSGKPQFVVQDSTFEGG
jgi:dolichol-phosphate mannosyltransferase